MLIINTLNQGHISCGHRNWAGVIRFMNDSSTNVNVTVRREQYFKTKVIILRFAPWTVLHDECNHITFCEVNILYLYHCMCVRQYVLITLSSPVCVRHCMFVTVRTSSWGRPGLAAVSLDGDQHRIRCGRLNLLVPRPANGAPCGASGADGGVTLNRACELLHRDVSVTTPDVRNNMKTSS